MIRLLLWVALVFPLILAGDWLLGHPGMMTVVWLDYTVEISTTLALLVMTAVGMVLVAALLLLWQLAHWPQRHRARRRYRTLERGLARITLGVTALAMGDEPAALAALKKAQRILPQQPLPPLLMAQMLRRQGKQDKAEALLQWLLDYEATAAFAAHALEEQHQAQSHWAETLPLAEPAPPTGWRARLCRWRRRG